MVPSRGGLGSGGSGTRTRNTRFRYSADAWWVVERTYGWLSRSRRLSKDDERKVQTSETLIQVAMIRLLLARLGRRDEPVPEQARRASTCLSPMTGGSPLRLHAFLSLSRGWAGKSRSEPALIEIPSFPSGLLFLCASWSLAQHWALWYMFTAREGCQFKAEWRTHSAVKRRK